MKEISTCVVTALPDFGSRRVHSTRNQSALLARQYAQGCAIGPTSWVVEKPESEAAISHITGMGSFRWGELVVAQPVSAIMAISIAYIRLCANTGTCCYPSPSVGYTCHRSLSQPYCFLFYFSDTYWEDIGAPNQSLCLNALQLVAKLHEVLIAASPSLVALSYVQYELLRWRWTFPQRYPCGTPGHRPYLTLEPWCLEPLFRF